MFIELLLLGGGGAFLYKDYRQGFSASRAILARIGLAKLVEEDVSSRAERLVNSQAKIVGMLEDRAGSIQASCEQNIRRAADYQEWIKKFGDLAEQATQRSMDIERRFTDDDTEDSDKIKLAKELQKLDIDAKTALLTRDQYRERLRAVEELIIEQRAVIEALDSQHQLASIGLDRAKVVRDTIISDVTIAETRELTYQLVSEVDAQTGFTVSGQLQELREKTEHRKLKAGAMLRLAERNNRSPELNALLQDANVNRELTDIRNRLALPAPSGNGHTEDKKIGDAQEIEVAEIVESRN
ncbi:MAG: hypothetical protein Q8R29_02635 [bacterium]|nr:hypothetical protein [bacterium]